jgi:hypothetical protein
MRTDTVIRIEKLPPITLELLDPAFSPLSPRSGEMELLTPIVPTSIEGEMKTLISHQMYL